MKNEIHHAPGSNRKRRAIALTTLFGIVALCTAAFAVSIVWTRKVARPGADHARDVTLDPSGNLYVSGSRTNDYNIWIRKYDPAGTKTWTRMITGTNGWADGIASDSSGNVFAVGHTYDPVERENIWIRKYDADGNKLWTRIINGAANEADQARAAAVDGDGDLFVVGGLTRDPAEAEDIWIRKYSAAGDRKWTRIVSGGANADDTAHGVAVDANGAVYVVGVIQREPAVASAEPNWRGDDIWIRKYSASGVKKWTRIVNGPANTDDVAYGAAVTPGGSLYVVGEISVDSNNMDIWIRKYSSSGEKKWTRTVSGNADSNDIAFGADVDTAGNVYVVGAKEVVGQDTNIWVRSYTSLGVTRWTKAYNNPDDEDDTAHGVAVNATGEIYVAGTIWPFATGRDIWIRKYAP